MNIDKSVKVYEPTRIDGNVTIGKDGIVGAFCHLIGDIVIGEKVRIQSFGFISGGAVIGDNVFLGPRVTILNDKRPPSKGKHWMPVIIKSDVVIGGNVTILPGVTIGKGAMVGAGSVVTKEVSPGSIVFGNPAKIYSAK